jgi:hypothetical protein
MTIEGGTGAAISVEIDPTTTQRVFATAEFSPHANESPDSVVWGIRRRTPAEMDLARDGWIAMTDAERGDGPFDAGLLSHSATLDTQDRARPPQQ